VSREEIPADLGGGEALEVKERPDKKSSAGAVEFDLQVS